MRSTNEYLGFVIAEHASKPKFMAELRALIDPLVQIQQFCADMPLAFDLDSAVGVQLDVDGMFIGPTRFIGAPVQSQWFMFDVAGHGWDAGVWKSPYKTEYYQTRLNDKDYRKLLKARIMANHWDGTIPGAQDVLNFFFDDSRWKVFIQDGGSAYIDNFFAFDTPDRGWDSAYNWRGPFWEDPGASDLNVTFCFAGRIPPLTYIFLLYLQTIPLVGAGVRAEFNIATKDNSELFAFDVSNDVMGGWDTGVWGASVDYIATYGLST